MSSWIILSKIWLQPQLFRNFVLSHIKNVCFTFMKNLTIILSSSICNLKLNNLSINTNSTLLIWVVTNTFMNKFLNSKILMAVLLHIILDWTNLYIWRQKWQGMSSKNSYKSIIKIKKAFLSKSFRQLQRNYMLVERMKRSRLKFQHHLKNKNS